MKRHWLKVLLALLLPTVAIAATREILVGTAPTLIPRTATTQALILYNNGPDGVCCAQGSDAGSPNCIPIAPGASLSLDIPSNQPVTCIAPTQQVADGGVRMLEVY